MHSGPSTAEHARIFNPTPRDACKIVLATNVAETSVTIPGVVAVIDCGRVKEVRHARGHQHYNRHGGAVAASALVQDWCSRANCKQRAGRAGRTAPGIVCRLFSKWPTFDEEMSANATPELRRVPLDNCARAEGDAAQSVQPRQ